MGLPGRCWIIIHREKIVFVFIDLVRIICPGTVGVSHPVFRNFKSHFPNIPSKKLANPTSREKALLGPKVTAKPISLDNTLKPSSFET